MLDGFSKDGQRMLPENKCKDINYTMTHLNHAVGWAVRVEAIRDNVPGDHHGINIWWFPFPPRFCRHIEIYQACHRVFLRRRPRICLFNHHHLVLMDVRGHAFDMPDNMGEAAAPLILGIWCRQLLLCNVRGLV